VGADDDTRMVQSDGAGSRGRVRALTERIDRELTTRTAVQQVGSRWVANRMESVAALIAILRVAARS